MRLGSLILIIFLFFQEIHLEEIDVDSAYILFYERKNLDYSAFMPKTSPANAATSDADSEETANARPCLLM